MIRISLIFSVLLIIFSCKTKKNNVAVEKAGNTGDTLEIVASDLYGGAEEEVFQVIRDAGELNKFYRKVNMTRKPGLPVPEIDFSKYTAILYCSGATTSEQMPALVITDRSNSEIQVRKLEQAKESKSDSRSAKLTPFGLYIVPFTDKEIILSTYK